jgi:DNA polymerase-1
VLDVMPAWIGEPGCSPFAGLAIVTDATVSEVAWIPGELVADESVAAIVAAHGNVRSHNAKPLMRSLLELGTT